MLGDTPSLREISACGPWLETEVKLIEPEVIVALGATAGKALLGPSFRVRALLSKGLDRLG